MAPKKLMFVTGKPFQPNVMKLYYLIGQYITYDEIEVLWIRA